MITEQELESAKHAMLSAWSTREAMWSTNGAPDYSVLAWLDELKKCNPAVNITRNEEGYIENPSNVGNDGCKKSTWDGRLKSFDAAIIRYKAAQTAYLSAKSNYDNLVDQKQEEEEISSSQAQTSLLNAQAGVEKSKAFAEKYEDIILFSVGGLLLLLIIFAFMWYYSKKGTKTIQTQNT